jgi:hypothetical protein
MEEDEEEENKGFLARLFEKITGVFSLIQLKPVTYDNVENFSFSQIQTKLEKILSIPQQINFLITTLHEFDIVLNSVKESVIYCLSRNTV